MSTLRRARLQPGHEEAAHALVGERSGDTWRRQRRMVDPAFSHMRINREEIFGPVVSVQRVKDYEAALALANDTPFGLSAGIATTSLKHATHFKRHSQAGMVMVNLPTAGVDYHVPFGGRKGSSYGPREQGAAAALARLVTLERDQKILERDIIAIDLRMPDRADRRAIAGAHAGRGDHARRARPAR